MLITTEVEEGNTIVSIGEFAFHSKHQKVIRRRTKKAEGVVLWAPQGERPEERVMESASALGTFAIMNLGAADESRKEIEALRAQVSILAQDLERASSERADLTAQLEQECVKQEVMAKANQSLQNQVKDLRAELKDSEISKAEVESFRQEAFLTSDRGLDARISFFKLIKNTKEMHLNLLRNEELLSHQREELLSMKEVRRKVAEYQKKNQINQIPRLDAMDLRHIQVSLNSAETLNEKARSTITSAKKECRRIWDSASTLIKELDLPQLEVMETILPDDSWVGVMEAAQQKRRESIREIKELKWKDVQSTLVDEARFQALIESWRIKVEISLQKRVMKGLCQSKYALENYKSENLLPLTNAHDQWESLLDQPERSQ